MPTLKPRTTVVTLFQGDDYDRERELREAVEAAARVAETKNRRLADGNSVGDRAAEYDAFVAEADERAEKLILQALPRTRWRELMTAHPAREGNDIDAMWGFNPETLCDDLVPESIVPGQFDGPGARDDFLDALSDADYSKVYAAARAVNQSQGPDPKVRLSSLLAQTSDETSEPPTRLG